MQSLLPFDAGADEYVVLLTQDYLRLVDSLIAQHSEAAQQLQLEEQQQARVRQQQQQQRNQQQREEQQQFQQEEEEQAGAPNSTATSSEHAAIAATLQAFRSRVLPACNESHITRSRLLQLMRTAAPLPSQSQPVKPPAAAAAAAAAALSSADAIQRRLLSAELVCRDSRATDSFMFTVPGAAAFVKSVVAGRQELLQMLKRKK
jgi:hypothetical protein